MMHYGHTRQPSKPLWNVSLQASFWEGVSSTPRIKAFWALKKINFDYATDGDLSRMQLNELEEFRHIAYENTKMYKEKTKMCMTTKLSSRNSTNDKECCYSTQG